MKETTPRVAEERLATDNNPSAGVTLEQMRNRFMHPLWPLYRKIRRYARRQMGYPQVPIEDEDIDRHLAKHMDDVLGTLSDLHLADVRMRRSIVPPRKPKDIRHG